MATYLAQPRAKLSFGDVCLASFFHDVHVQQDAHRLTPDVAPVAFVQKKGWGTEPITYFIPLEDSPDGLVLAHGKSHPMALCLSDDCAIDTAFGRGERDAKGRLLFAPLVRPTEGDLEILRENPSYGRLEVAADDTVAETWVVNLRNCYLVDVAALQAAGPELILRSTTDEFREVLANQWAAYAARRGPIVIEDNSEKLAGLLYDNGIQAELARAVAGSVANVAAAGWGLEGGALERAGQAADEHGDAAAAIAAIAAIADGLDRLAALVAVAQGQVATARGVFTSTFSDPNVGGFRGPA